MKIIYLDSDYRCYTQYEEGRRIIETDEFDNKTDEDINCFRYIPYGEIWERSDGVLFKGTMIAPANKNPSEIEDMKTALNLLGVEDDGQMDE